MGERLTRRQRIAEDGVDVPVFSHVEFSQTALCGSDLCGVQFKIAGSIVEGRG